MAGPTPRFVTTRLGTLAVSLVLSAVMLACSGDDDPSGPSTGTINVTTATTGESPDADGYTVSVDGGQAQAVAATGSLQLTGVAAGNHSVGLGGVAANCTVAGDNPRSVTVTAGAAATAAFAVTCVSTAPTTGSISVTVATTGASPDPDGYAVAVDGGAPQAIAVNGSLTIADLAVGTHTVQLTGAAGNCTVTAPNPQSVDVTAGGTVAAAFAVTCVAPPSGEISLTVTTAGASPDPDGYAVTIDGGAPIPVGVNGVTPLTGLTPGSHTLQLVGVAGNCTVTAPNPRPVEVTDGGTTATTFEVACPSVARILFVSNRDHANYEIYSALPDGSGVVRITNNTTSEGDASWSPDYTKIVFSSNADGDFEVYVMNADGTGVQQLTQANGDDGFAVFSPDGSKIAFTSERGANAEVYVMNADGTNVVNVSQGEAVDQAPSWSPDGAKIVFGGSRSGNFEIYSVNADGTGLTPLGTSPEADILPSYSPDGTKIVFMSARDEAPGEIYVMNTDGTGVVRLTTSTGQDTWPRWSPDGTRIIFQSGRDGNMELYTMNPDGSNVVNVTSNGAADIRPAWRP
jgi:TolB protein